MLAGEPALVGASPWVLARRRLLRNRVAMAMVGVLVLIVALCVFAMVKVMNEVASSTLAPKKMRLKR